MNIFVTVGHTYYDALFKAIDEQLSPDKYHVVNQISDGSYQPKNHQHFKYSIQFQNEISNADLVITHAGAGSVFHLLEISKPMLIVPNFDRIDNHQKDMVDFVVKNNYSNVWHDLAQLEKCVLESVDGCFSKYEKNRFCGYDKILDVINHG